MQNYFSNKIFKRSAKGLRPISNYVSKIASLTFKKRGFFHSEIVTSWKTIVGDNLYKKCIPIKITFPPKSRSEGTLSLLVDGPIAVEIQYHQDSIIEKINSYFGYSAIKTLKLTQLPFDEKSERKVKKSQNEPKMGNLFENVEIDKIENINLKEALLKLRKSIEK